MHYWHYNEMWHMYWGNLTVGLWKIAWFRSATAAINRSFTRVVIISFYPFLFHPDSRRNLEATENHAQSCTPILMEPLWRWLLCDFQTIYKKTYTFRHRGLTCLFFAFTHRCTKKFVTLWRLSTGIRTNSCLVKKIPFIFWKI